MTKIPTRKSATASDITKQLVTVRSLRVVNTATIIRVFPICKQNLKFIRYNPTLNALIGCILSSIIKNGGKASPGQGIESGFMTLLVSMFHYSPADGYCLSSGVIYVYTVYTQRFHNE